ncbi:peptide chain release factor N(5)-glutamine methyltransferase [Panacagrimonas sp.]|uniref:peptide chain release factor N(5)-glutamine methyltransferase n=1 Tax=Panacagrimonas sp. TaxID=2480088 RepID=UPI003B52813A
MSAMPLPPIRDTQPRPVAPVEGLAPGTAQDWLGWAARELEAHSDSAQADAEVLLAALLQTPRSQLRGALEQPLSAALVLRYAAQVERRRQGEPVAYLSGRQGFWTLDLQVDNGVLIPRPDTETLVEWALQWARDLAAPRLLDLGTGSGAIALALADGLRQRTPAVWATDVSPAALRIARDNARELQLPVEFREGSWFEALESGVSPFDLIVSNPPYVAADDPHLPDLRYEPRLALTAGVDGLDAIRDILCDAATWLKPGGLLLLEHGCDQAAAVRALLNQTGFAGVQTRRDLGGRERVSGGLRP